MPRQPIRLPQAKNAEPRKAAPAVVTPFFDALPDSALIRQSQLVQDSKRPNVPAPLPFSPTTLWRKVRNNQFPAPVRLSSGMTAWRVADVRRWLAQFASNDDTAEITGA